MMTLEIKGLDKLARKLDERSRDTAVKQGMNDSGNLLKYWIMKERLSAPPGYSATMLHVVTGRLRTSIAKGLTPAEKTGGAYILKIGTNVEYAPKHEYGIGVRKRPFMSASIEDRKNQDNILRLITRALQEALDK